MSLPDFSIKKKVTVYMLTVLLVLVGVLAFLKLPQELYPPISFPQITIVTEYSNAAPEEIETLITRVIEEAIGSVAGLKRIESISREGRSTIMVSFNWGQDIDFAALALREKIDLVKERIPKEASDPVVLKYDPLSKPILIISVSGPELPPVRLKLLTEKMLKDRLEKVEGVASVTLSGGVNREILVEVDQPRLQANHLSLLEVVNSLDEANVSYPAGSIKKGLYEYLIRTVGDFRSPAEIGYSVVGVDTVEKGKREDASFVEKDTSEEPRGTIEKLRGETLKRMLQKRLVVVKDMAKVIDGLAEKTSVSRYNGEPNISLQIQKQSNANTIRLVDQLKKELAGIQDDLNSRGVRFKIIYDHSIFIRNSLENLAHEAIMGSLLALVCLYFFLRNFAMALLVVFTIPTTILGVFLLMAMTSVTLNMMSLGGLALAIGIITDTSIVVLENIFRKRQGGMDHEKGAVEGADEVVWPVVSSNLTGIAVFFPLIVFVPGVAGQFFKDLSWSMVFAHIFCIFIPLTIITLLSIYVRVEEKEYAPMSLTGSLDQHIMGLPTVRQQNWFMIKILAAVFLVLASSFFIVPTMDFEVLPKMDQGAFYAKVNMPLGTRLEVTDKICQRLEKVIKEEPEVRDIDVAIGSEKSNKGDPKFETLRSSQAMVTVTLKEKRKRSSTKVISSILESMKKLNLDKEDAHVEFVLQGSDIAAAGASVKPILIEVKGYDFAKTELLVNHLKNRLAEIPGVVNIDSDMGEKSPETKLEINKKRASLYGISAMDISLTAKAAIEGVEATQYREASREIPVRVRLAQADRANINNLNNLLLYSKTLDIHVPLKEIATIKQGLGPSEIKRMDQERTVTVAAEIDKTRKDKDVLADVQKFLSSLKVPDDIPEDFQVHLSGKAKELHENFSSVIFAFILSILLVYMIMAAQFESFLQPLMIMVTVPLSFGGAIVALKVTGNSLNVISALGVVLLGGIVVYNGIVLMEYTNQLRVQGMELSHAVWLATRTRTRPVLMSSTTNIVAMLPVAIGIGGAGSEILAPLAITVMGGLFSSTILTLIVLPCITILFTRFIESRMGIEEEEGPSEGEATAS